MNERMILHPTDGSVSAQKALEFACDLALARKAGLLLLHVQEHHGKERIPSELEEYAKWERVRETEADMLRSAAERIASNAERDARQRGVHSVETLVIEGDASREIIQIATLRNVDAIVMGSRGLGDLAALLLGSVSHKVVQAAPCTCVVVR